MINYRWLFVIIMGLTVTMLSADWEEFGTLSDAEKIYGLSLIWKEADYNYPHFHQLPDLDWDSEYQSYLSEVIETKNIYEYYRVLQKFAALLEDCHTRVTVPESFQAKLDYPLIKLEKFGERVIVSNVGNRHADQLPIGSIILEVDELPVTEYLEKVVYPYISASNRAVLHNKAMSMFFFGLKDSETEVKFRHPGDNNDSTQKATGRATIIRNRMGDRWVNLPDSRVELMDYRWLDDEVLYTAMFSFNDELIIRMFENITDDLAECQGLIIDLRDNRLGRTEVSNEILRFLTEEETLTGVTKETRKNIALYKAWGTPIYRYSYIPPEEYLPYGKGDVWHREDPEIIVNDDKKEKITVPLVILINSETAAAAEDFLVALLAARRNIKLVGSHTAGSRGQALIRPLPGRGKVWITAHRDIYGDDQILSRLGIRPDSEVEMNYSDFLKGNDPVLDKGYEVIRQMLEK